MAEINIYLKLMKEYIEYWDEVIREWSKGDGTTKSIPQTERIWFNNTNTNLIPEYMPEPYGGNPNKCSAVVVNYNPGASITVKKDEYCHISQVAIKGSMPDIMGQNYSKIALKFPWLNSSEQRPGFMNDDRLNPTIKWLKNRAQWVESLIDKTSDSEEKLIPFFIDICGWHSKNWKGVKFKSNKSHDATPLVEYLKNRILPVLMYAIPRSQLGVGLCVGKQFADVILPILGFKAITESFQPKEEKRRFFQAFEKDGVKILCTWSWASNKRPSDAYLTFEKELISKLRT